MKHKLFQNWFRNTELEQPVISTAQIKSSESVYQEWLDNHRKAVNGFKDLIQQPSPENYTPIILGDYPSDNDEVWVEAYSGEPGIRHDDLAGYIRLKELKTFMEHDQYICWGYKHELKKGNQYPAGSSAFRLARSRKLSL